MATNETILTPQSLIVPTIESANQVTASTPTGLIGVSGAVLVFFDGTQWRKVTSS